MMDHPYNRDHACLGCAYGCACKQFPLSCVTCGEVFPPRTYNGTDLAYCSAACDPNAANRWRSPFVNHDYATGCCETADYLHVQTPRVVERVEAETVGIGRHRAFPRERLASPDLARNAPRVITRNLGDGMLHLRSQIAGGLMADERCAGTGGAYERIRQAKDRAVMCAVCWPPA